MTDELIGKNIGGYEIVDIIGRGGMATVYRAQQVSMHRTVALKVLPRQYIHDDTYLQRFNQEVKIVSQLEHRNIVPVHDYGEYEGQPYIVMRYMNAGSVDDLLKRGPLDIERIVSILEQIAPALDYAHSKNVLHRDLKPSNILLDDDGGAYITDFGIARILGEQFSAITTQGVVGTPSYMSPEQAQGHPLDNRSDLYSLGVMLFEMATGRRPFESDTPYSIAVMQVTTPPPSPRIYNAGLSFAIEEVILKAMKKKREERYPHAVGLAEALKRATNHHVLSLHDTQPGIPRQLPTPEPIPAQPVAPAPILPPAPQPAYYTPPPSSASLTPNPAPATGSYIRRRRRPKGSNAWLSAALGGIIGCGVLVLLLVIAALIVSTVLNAELSAKETPPPGATAPPSGSRSQSSGVAVPLDATSETARSTLLPIIINTDVPPPSPTVGELAPIGVRETPTLTENVREISHKLVYFAEHNSNYDLFVLDLQTGVETQLTFDDAVDSYPHVSPDGQQIVFQSNRDGDFDIYVMNLDGSNLRRLTHNTLLDRLPAWSPDGEWIVYSADTREDGFYDLYRMRADGSDQDVVFSNGERNSHARYSPDGRYLAFTNGPNPEDASTWEIGLLDLETSDFKRLTNNTYNDWGPSFSPDGRSILFLTAGEGAAASQGKAAIARMDTDGSNVQIIYDGIGYEWGASYSPDSQYITFTTISGITSQEEVVIMQADGAGVEPITNQGGLYAAWVP